MATTNAKLEHLRKKIQAFGGKVFENDGDEVKRQKSALLMCYGVANYFMQQLVVTDEELRTAAINAMCDAAWLMYGSVSIKK